MVEPALDRTNTAVPDAPEPQIAELRFKFPEIPSYPHIFLLETDGSLLLSQTPDAFIKDDKYVPDLILAFLEQWAPKAKA